MDPSSVKSVPPGIVTALKGASRATGTDFDYLLKTAVRESALKPGAKARTSTASGLFQFIEQTWLGTVKAAGGKHGLGKLSAMIHQDRNGKFHVTDPSKRKAVLALRFDPKLSALMAGEFTRANEQAIRQRIGRNPTDGELYIGHFLGAGKASKLINMASKSPDSPADAYFPRAAKANRAIFHSKSGKSRSIAEVYRNLTSHYSNQLAGFSKPNEEAGQNATGIQKKGPVRPLTHALFTLWRTPDSSVQAGQGRSSAFHNLFQPGRVDEGTSVKPEMGAAKTDVNKPVPLIPSAEAFLSAFGAQSNSSPAQAPATRTAAGRINGVWGEKNHSDGLLARRRPGAI